MIVVCLLKRCDELAKWSFAKVLIVTVGDNCSTAVSGKTQYVCKAFAWAFQFRSLSCENKHSYLWYAKSGSAAQDGNTMIKHQLSETLCFLFQVCKT